MGRTLAGAVAAVLAVLAAGVAADLLGGVTGHSGPAGGLRRFLAEGGWLRLPLAGAALGAVASAWAARGASRVGALALAVGFACAGVLLQPAPVSRTEPGLPTSPRGKTRAILKWSYESPAGVSRILALSRDPDPRIREQAILALGVNLIVDDIERASELRPSRWSGAPVRGELGVRLREALASDSVEAVRAEAARALWKSPRAFGTEPAAAETLASVLGRALEPGAVERLTWLALDAAAGPEHRVLKAAALRFAEATPDSELARVARFAGADSAGGREAHRL